MKTARVHAVQIDRGEPLRGDDGGPPLIAHRRHVQRLEQFERHVGLNDRVRLLIFEYLTAKFGKPCLLVISRCDGGLELFFRHYAPNFRTKP